MQTAVACTFLFLVPFSHLWVQEDQAVHFHGGQTYLQSKVSRCIHETPFLSGNSGKNLMAATKDTTQTSAIIHFAHLERKKGISLLLNRRRQEWKILLIIFSRQFLMILIKNAW
jgi:hypothetical protein